MNEPARSPTRAAAADPAAGPAAGSESARVGLLGRGLALIDVIAGDPRRCVLEHRVFSVISLFFGVANIGGALNFVDLDRYTPLLLIVHLASGLVFLGFYLSARLRNVYRPLYWPFVLLILGFLTISVLNDAGSMGGSHYYLFMAIVVTALVAHRSLQLALALLLFSALTVVLFMLEIHAPQLFTRYPGEEQQRLLELASQFVFVQVVTALIVKILSRNLASEREKAERLLQRILPETVALELKQTARVEPRYYASASVMFTDFVGFTRTAESLSPQELIECLDRHFREFDRITSQLSIEKIKTIGDAYMAVAGIPELRPSHAVDAVLAALLITRYADRVSTEQQHSWRLRAGVHTGPLVAGVIGENKFAYDVWGKTVNTASRMESSGEVSRVNISGTTHELVREYFECQHRGQIEAKNIGPLDMYFVLGLRPELRDEETGGPNELFWTRRAGIRAGG